MSSRKQQALDRLLDVSGPGCFNEVTGTWMVGRRHHHHRRPIPLPAPELAPEPEASKSETPTKPTGWQQDLSRPTHLIKTVMDYPPMSAFPKNSTGGSIIPIGTIYRSQPTKYGHAFGPPVLMWVKAPHQYVQISLAQANTIPQ